MASGISGYMVNGIQVGNYQSSREQYDVEQAVRLENAKTALNGRKIKQELDKEDFLTLLVTQLQNQDPTNPMEDKEFIAQMAQFSTLEQMNNMSAEFTKLAGKLSSSQAMEVLGRDVDIILGDTLVSGRVDEVTSGDYPQVMVAGAYYDYQDIARVRRD